MATLLVFSDYGCPWCYVGSARSDRLVREFALDRRLVHFPLHPGIAPEGVRLVDLVRGIDLAAAHARLHALATAEGLPFAPRDRAYSTRLAQELGTWASERGTPIDDRLFRAVFAEGRNVSDPEVLVAIAGEGGLPVDEARTVLAERTHREKVDADWQLAREYGVTGVPTYAIGGRGVTGAQPYGVLEQLATTAGIPRRSPG